MTFEELISFCKPVKVLGSTSGTLGELVQDSRKVTPGDIFIAVKGSQSDGHDFVEMAISEGADIIIVETEKKVPSDVCELVVQDTRKLLSPLALELHQNPQEKIISVGITGTNGKTTVATLVYQILSQLGHKSALLGTVEKRIGTDIYPSKLTTPGAIELAQDILTVAEAGCQYLVMEVSSHALDQERASGIPFKVGAFTNLSRDHLDYHKTVEAYAQAKKKLFDSLSDDAFAVINRDDTYSRLMIEDCKAAVWQFSFGNKSDLKCKILSNTSDGLTIDINGTQIQSPLTGEFNAYNIAEAYLICLALGCSKSNIASALSSARGAPGRLEKITTDITSSLPVIFVDYAHTPDALEKVSSTLSQIKVDNQKLHIVFGCGGNRDVGKRPQMAAIAEKYGDYVIATSDNPRFEDPETIIDDIMVGFSHPEKVKRESDREKAIIYAINQASSNDIILIAGKGHEDYQEVNGERHHFDDREIARAALLALKNNIKADKEVR